MADYLLKTIGLASGYDMSFNMPGQTGYKRFKTDRPMEIRPRYQEDFYLIFELGDSRYKRQAVDLLRYRPRRPVPLIGKTDLDSFERKNLKFNLN